MGEVRTAVLERFRALVDEVSNAREMQERRDAWISFQQKGQAWEAATIAAWQTGLQVAGQGVHPRYTASTFELMGDDVVENKILSSRLGQAVLERTAEPHADLVARLQMLEGTEELIPQDPVRPEAMMLAVVEQWTAAGMLRTALPLVMPVLQREFTVHLLDAYNSSLAFLSANGVEASSDLRGRVKRSEGGSSTTLPPGPTALHRVNRIRLPLGRVLARPHCVPLELLAAAVVPVLQVPQVLPPPEAERRPNAQPRKKPA